MPQIQINGINLYYELKGKQDGAEAVVFLNGLMSSSNSWALQVPVFEKDGFKILLHDFRGQLKSDKPIEPYTFKQHALDLKALLDQLGIDKIHIVSTSYGSLVGMRFTVDFPAYVKSLVMIDALPELDDTFRRIAADWQALIKAGDMVKFYRVASTVIYSPAYIQNHQDSSHEREVLLSKLPPEYKEALHRLIDNTLHNAHLTAELPQITCPVLLACGENDQLSPLKFSKLMQQQIPQAELVIVPECGHAMVSEKPDVVNDLALGFIRRYS